MLSAVAKHIDQL